MGMENVHRGRPGRRMRLGLRLGGAVLLVITGVIHLDLYLTGYKSIPTIGPLFLMQVIACFGLALIIAASGSRLAAAAGAAFGLATLGGYLLAIWVGLFGFTEVRTEAGVVAGVVDILAFAALGAFALTPAARSQHASRRSPSPLLDRMQTSAAGAARAVTAVSVLAFVLLGVAVAGAAGLTPTPAATSAHSGSDSGPATLKTERIDGKTVLANSQGLTLYWFAPDKPNKSVCYGSCAVYWPPQPGPVKPPPGVTGKFRTITRKGGGRQETYNGHPLYTYISDHAPGQARGNNINLNGGLWHEVVVSTSS
jgi:predicted lipoprotein with Yx(FWY)xxD motif